MATLGILITSDRHIAYANEIARAAHDKGHTVRIHLTGSGVKFAHSPAFGLLGAWARITICRKSAAQIGLAAALAERYPHLPAVEEPIADIILSCDRHLVL